MKLHLWNMLVVQAQAVEAKGAARAWRGGVLELGDHRPATAGITRHGVDRHRPGGRQQTGRDERTNQRDEPRRVAPRVGDAAGSDDGFALALRHFRESVGPARGCPVGAGRIDDPHRLVFDQAGGLARRVVGQAQDDHVGDVEPVAARRQVLAHDRIYRDQFDVAPRREPLADTKAGRPRLAVDEDLRDHGRLSEASRIRPPGQRLENWKLRRALALPYFLRSTTRLSRVRNPCGLRTARRPGS